MICACEPFMYTMNYLLGAKIVKVRSPSMDDTLLETTWKMNRIFVFVDISCVLLAEKVIFPTHFSYIYMALIF